MDPITVLEDMVSRPRTRCEKIAPRLTLEAVNAHPLGHPNSVAWLLWHTGREVDIQLVELTDAPQTWDRAHIADATGIARDTGEMGYGDSSDQAAAVHVGSEAQVAALASYVLATLDDLSAYISSCAAQDLNRVVATYEGENILLATRLVSIIDDATQHLAQIDYILGAPSYPCIGKPRSDSRCP